MNALTKSTATAALNGEILDDNFRIPSGEIPAPVRPTDLLSEAFKCSGSVTRDSAPWKAQAISNIEARLAVAWSHARKTEVYGDPAKDPEDAKMARDETDADVFDAIPDAPTYNDLCDVLDQHPSEIQASLRRLVRAGRVCAMRMGDRHTYSHAPFNFGGPVEAFGMAARIASAKSKRAAADAKLAKVAELHAGGMTSDLIAEQVGLTRRYVLGLICKVKKGDVQ